MTSAQAVARLTSADLARFENYPLEWLPRLGWNVREDARGLPYEIWRELYGSTRVRLKPAAAEPAKRVERKQRQEGLF